MSQIESLSDRYNPSEIESEIYSLWMKNNAFSAESQSEKPAFCIMLPPPNVTGSLHIGHALDHTIQDTLVRWKRMSGFNTLWLPGTDHAGIATQSVVERELKKENKTRKDLGRDKFLEKVWQWKEEYGGRIIEQMKRLGDSCDWSRLRFTMDEGCSLAVRKVFVQLYNEGLIYQGEKLVNWDPKLESAVSDLEVEHKEIKGHLWHIRYSVIDSDQTLTIATTRPETLLGDTAICVHPEDERYRSLIGKKVLIPLINREVDIIADEYVDKSFGSGVVKITPAHDFNDYEIGQRHNLEFVNILNPNGTLNKNAGPYVGLSLQEARKRVLSDLKELNILEKEEPHKVSQPISDRSGEPIEPYLSKQWFVKMESLAKPAKDVVENSEIQFIPDLWKKTYLHWLNNIQDWCVSRQLWWGHRIPAWTCKDCKEVIVSESDPTQCPKCKSQSLSQDPDVLDTWFSSGLWPFSTLGWPEETDDLKTFYPTSVLITGHDIIFFWVSRMIIQGLHFKKEIPFKDIYIHGLIRDSQGKKMSKSVGNTVDPLEIIEKFGADALRFTLLAQLFGGRDLKFSEQRLEGYRNFMNKIWNATRFALSTVDENDLDKLKKIQVPDTNHLSLPDIWITQKLKDTITHVDKALSQYRFSDAALGLYNFVWHDFCDWYLEFIKPRIYGNNQEEKISTQVVLLQTLDRIMKLLHPMAPFISETIFQKLPLSKGLLATSSYPSLTNDQDWLSIASQETANELDFIRDIISAIRNIRGENKITPSQEINACVLTDNKSFIEIIENNQNLIQRMSKLSSLELCKSRELKKCALTPITFKGKQLQVVVPLEGLVDLSQEIQRIEKNLEKLQKEKQGLEGRLNNKNFVNNAPKDVLDQAQENLSELTNKIKHLDESLIRLR